MKIIINIINYEHVNRQRELYEMRQKWGIIEIQMTIISHKNSDEDIK